MTHEEFFKNGDKFIYESFSLDNYLVYEVRVENLQPESQYMQISFRRFRDDSFCNSHFLKTSRTQNYIFKIKEVY
jgi:hypothetical protein